MTFHTINQDLCSKFRNGDHALYTTIQVDESKGKYHVGTRHVTSAAGAITSIFALACATLGKLAQTYNFRNGLTALCTSSNLDLLTNATITSNVATTLLDTTLVTDNRPRIRSALIKEAGLALGSFAHLAKPLAVQIFGATQAGRWAATSCDIVKVACRIVSLVRPLIRTKTYSDFQNVALGKASKAKDSLKNTAKDAKKTFKSTANDAQAKTNEIA